MAPPHPTVQLQYAHDNHIIQTRIGRKPVSPCANWPTEYRIGLLNDIWGNEYTYFATLSSVGYLTAGV